MKKYFIYGGIIFVLLYFFVTFVLNKNTGCGAMLCLSFWDLFTIYPSFLIEKPIYYLNILFGISRPGYEFAIFWSSAVYFIIGGFLSMIFFKIKNKLTR